MSDDQRARLLRTDAALVKALNRITELEAELATHKTAVSIALAERAASERDLAAAQATIAAVKAETARNIAEQRFIWEGDDIARQVIDCFAVYASQSSLLAAPSAALDRALREAKAEALENLARKARAKWAPEHCPWGGALDDEAKTIREGGPDGPV